MRKKLIDYTQPATINKIILAKMECSPHVITWIDLVVEIFLDSLIYHTTSLVVIMKGLI